MEELVSLELSGTLGGGFNIFFYFHPYLGKIPILTIFFFEGVETTN